MGGDMVKKSVKGEGSEKDTGGVCSKGVETFCHIDIHF